MRCRLSVGLQDGLFIVTALAALLGVSALVRWLLTWPAW